MLTHTGLTAGEFRAVCAAFRQLRLSDCTPDYFRDFLVLRLSEGRPALAAKVRDLAGWQVDALCEEVKEHQARGDDSDPPSA